MKAIITGKSELRLSDLTREYTFDIVTNDGDAIIESQVKTCRPSEVKSLLTEVVAEYQAAYEDDNDVQIGDEVV